MIYASAHVYVALIQSNRPTHFLLCITDNSALNWIHSRAFKKLKSKIEFALCREILATYFAVSGKKYSSWRCGYPHYEWCGWKKLDLWRVPPVVYNSSGAVKYLLTDATTICAIQTHLCRDFTTRGWPVNWDPLWGTISLQKSTIVGVDQYMQENNVQNLPEYSRNYTSANYAHPAIEL